MSNVFPSLESPEFEQAFVSFVSHLKELAALFDAHHVERRADLATDDSTPSLPPQGVSIFELILTRFNELLEEYQLLGAFINAFVTTNSRDTVAQARLSALQQQAVTLFKLDTRFTAWLGSLDAPALLASSELARAHSYAIERAAVEAAHQMSPPEEDLAAELSPSSGTAWSRLHGNVSSQLAVELELDGQPRSLPMSAVRNLAFEPDRSVRERAYRAELDAWIRNAVPLAAALNSIKGQVNTLSARRGWDTPLDAALFDSAIDRATLDAMLTAARASFPDFRRYLHAKARALGLSRLAWFDIFAPLGQSTRVWAFEDARAFILEHFGSYSPRLQGLARRAFAERWIDAEPRPGKRDGAFCMLVRHDESRVLANYKEAYGGMSTLAHELGHAYHNLVKADRTAVQRSTPMTLAETASIFCETIVREAALAQADAGEQLAILEASLQDSCQVVVDITSRFLFENRVFEARRTRELSVEELCVLMRDAQLETYGDGLDPENLHPYMWAVKGHYYSAGLSFYNFPYMFGLLFGLGLYAQYQVDPDRFRAGYDDLLSSTGMADAATLAARFGIDTRTPAFWRASLDQIRRQIAQFEQLTGPTNPSATAGP